MEPTDFFGLIHPVIAVIFVFLLVINVANLAWQGRQ